MRNVSGSLSDAYPVKENYFCYCLPGNDKMPRSTLPTTLACCWQTSPVWSPQEVGEGWKRVTWKFFTNGIADFTWRGHQQSKSKPCTLTELTQVNSMKSSQRLPEILLDCFPALFVIPYSSYSIRQNVPYKFTEIGKEVFAEGREVRGRKSMKTC